MLIGFGMPAVTNVTLSGGTWLTLDTWQALVDGRPARAARINRSGTVTITLTLASSIQPTLIALLGLNVPAGTLVTAAGTSANAVALPDGTVGAFIHRAGSATSSVAITVAGTGMLQIGEIAVMRSLVLPHEPDWSDDLVDPTQYELSRASQPAGSARRPYRVLTAQLTADGIATVRGGGLGGMDWLQLRHALAAGRCIAIPRNETVAERHATAIYGKGRFLAVGHVRGNWHRSALEVQEVPALAA